MTRRVLLATGLMLVWSSLACGTLTTTATTPEPEIVVVTGEPVPTPTEPVSTETPAADVLAAPPPLDVWPLTSDLFYLGTDARLYRQPMLGDETTAAPVTPANEPVLDFAVAPGGDWVMTRTANAVSITGIDGLRGQVIARDVGEPGTIGRASMAWSADAARLAYATERGFQVYYRGGGADFRVQVFDVTEAPVDMLLWSPNGTWLYMVRMDGTSALYQAGETFQAWVELGSVHSAAWTPSNQLVFAPVDGGLVLLSPDNLDSRSFLVPASQRVSLPAPADDGTLRFFIHGDSHENPGVLHRVMLPGGTLEQISTNAVYTTGRRWDGNATRLIEVQAGGFHLIEPVTGAQGIAPALTPPAGVLAWADAPPTEVTGVAMDHDLYFLAPQAGITQVWRLPSNGEAPTPVTRELTNVLAYSISPDGTQLLYTSGGAIYRQVVNTTDVVEVVQLSADADGRLSTPSFSPTGRQIAYADGGIWVRDLDTLATRRLIADIQPQSETDRRIAIYSNPRWSSDGNWLLATVTYTNGSDQVLISVAEEYPQAWTLSTFNAAASWNLYGAALVYSPGGSIAEAGLSQVFMPIPNEDGTPGEPEFGRLLNLPVVDVQPLSDGRLFLLRTPVPGTLGPTSVTVYSISSDGASLQRESISFIMEEAVLSFDANFVAGLYRPTLNGDGDSVGRLLIFSRETGQIVALRGVTSVFNIQWSPG